MREKQAFTLFSTGAVGRIVSDNPVFQVLDPELVSRKTIEIDEAFSPLSGLDARLFAVPGRCHSFSRTASPIWA